MIVTNLRLTVNVILITPIDNESNEGNLEDNTCLILFISHQKLPVPRAVNYETKKFVLLLVVCQSQRVSESGLLYGALVFHARALTTLRSSLCSPGAQWAG